MKKILYSALAMVAIAACSKGDDVADLTNDNQVRISSSIASRASDGAWEAGDAIGLYMNETAGDLGALASNKKYTTALGDGLFDADEKLFYPPTANVDFLAYYPHSEDAAFDVTAYEVDVTSQAEESLIDLLSAKLVDQAKTPEAVELAFDHKLTRIAITSIEPGEGVEAADLEGMKVYLDGVATKALFDLTTDAISGLDLTTSQLYFNTAEAGTSATAVVIPQKLTDVVLKFETKTIGTLEAAIKSAEYVAGKEYSYTVTLNRTKVNLSGATINPWGAGNGDGDDLDATLPEPNMELVDGYYQIYSAQGLVEFATKVNAGEGEINGKLMTNIDLGGVDSEGSGIEGKEFTQIGLNGSTYDGIFDGNGYEISGLYVAEIPFECSGLFGTIGSNGVVKNLGVSGHIYNMSSDSGSIVGVSYGCIFNCYSSAKVDIYWGGGLVGENSGSILNCYFCGENTKENGEAIVGSNVFGSVNNCYYAEGSADDCSNGSIMKTVAAMQDVPFVNELMYGAAMLNTQVSVACGWKWNDGGFPTLVSGNYPPAPID